MIVDKIENAGLYKNISPLIAKGLEILASQDFSKIPQGKHTVDGDDIFYIVQGYKTSPVEQGKLEAHRKYIDIQFIAKGQELIGCTNIDSLECQTPYDQEKDIAFYKQPKDFTAVVLKEGMFCILFPQDAHMPGRKVNNPSEVLKIVVKIKSFDT